MTTTPIFLSEKDVKVFKDFQRHYALIGLLESLGVFDMTSGSVEIHFDSWGKIGHIEVHRHYRPSPGLEAGNK